MTLGLLRVLSLIALLMNPCFSLGQTVISGKTTVSGYTQIDVPTGTISTGNLSGTVVDSTTSAVIAGVSVAYSGSLGGSGSTTTASDGTYSFTSLTPDTYAVTFSKTGYITDTPSIYVVGGGYHTVLNEPLTPTGHPPPPPGPLPTVPANAKTFHNLQIDGTSPFNYIVCNANTGCRAGTPSCHGSAAISFGDFTHNLSVGGSLKFTNTTNSGSPTGCNTLIYRHLGTSWLSDDGTRTVTLAGITNALLHWHVYITPSSGGVVGPEWDPDWYVAHAWTYKASIACYTTSGTGVWAVYDQSIQNWRKTSTPCHMNTTGANAWHEFYLWVTINQTTHKYTYQALVLDGATIFSPTSPPNVGNTFSGWAHDSGDELNTEFQWDNKSAAGTSTEWLDEGEFSVW